MKQIVGLIVVVLAAALLVAALDSKVDLRAPDVAQLAILPDKKPTPNLWSSTGTWTTTMPAYVPCSHATTSTTTDVVACSTGTLMTGVQASY